MAADNTRNYRHPDVNGRGTLESFCARRTNKGGEKTTNCEEIVIVTESGGYILALH